MNDERLALARVDLAPESSERIRRLARADVGRAPGAREIWDQRFAAAGAAAFAAVYLVWAWQQAHLLR